MWFKPRCAGNPLHLVAALCWTWGRCVRHAAHRRAAILRCQDENLQTINLLLGYYTDGLSTQRCQRRWWGRSDRPPEFAFELQRLWLYV